MLWECTVQIQKHPLRHSKVGDETGKQMCLCSYQENARHSGQEETGENQSCGDHVALFPGTRGAEVWVCVGGCVCIDQ